MAGLLEELNRLAATEDLGAAGAANAYAGTSGLELVGALNAKAGVSGLDLQGVCNHLAGTNGLGVLEALSRVDSNAIADSSFETGVANWTATRGTISRVTTDFLFGTASLRYDSDTLATGVRFVSYNVNKIPVTVGKRYTASAFAKSGATFTNMNIDVAWFDSTDTFISTSLGTSKTITTTDWTRNSSTFIVPSGAASAGVNVVIGPDPAITAAHVFVDGVMFEPGVLTEYKE